MKTTPSGGAPSPSQVITWPGCHWWPRGRSLALVLVQNQTPDCRNIEDHIMNDSQVCVLVITHIHPHPHTHTHSIWLELFKGHLKEVSAHQVYAGLLPPPEMVPSSISGSISAILSGTPTGSASS